MVIDPSLEHDRCPSTYDVLSDRVLQRVLREHLREILSAKRGDSFSVSLKYLLLSVLLADVSPRERHGDNRIGNKGRYWLCRISKTIEGEHR